MTITRHIFYTSSLISVLWLNSRNIVCRIENHFFELKKNLSIFFRIQICTYTNFNPFLFIKVSFFIRIKSAQDIFFHLGIWIKFDLLSEQLYTSFICLIFILHSSNIRRQCRLNPDCIENNCLLILSFLCQIFLFVIKKSNREIKQIFHDFSLQILIS